jgi:hypothetical protein
MASGSLYFPARMSSLIRDRTASAVFFTGPIAFRIRFPLRKYEMCQVSPRL